MPKRRPPADISRVKTYPVERRESKVAADLIARLPDPSAPLSAFFDSLPNILKAKDLREFAKAIVEARRRDRAIIFMMGAHVIKCGLSPLINDMIRRGLITTLAANGATMIHDFELAQFGHTSEDVDDSLRDGSFGMAKETGAWLNEIAKSAAGEGIGLGEAVGRAIAGDAHFNADLSVFAAAHKHGVPACVHVAIGTDIVHQHPSMDGAAVGAGSYRDFLLLAGQVPDLNGGGVVINFGSAVIMPEVFLKALSVARNLGHTVENFTAANFDQIRHYRPSENVLRRPTLDSGRAYHFTGHHEIMLPLLYAASIRE